MMNAPEKQQLCLHLSKIDLPQCSVTFCSQDKELDNLMAKAEEKALGNIVQLSPMVVALVEGSQYQNIFLETQPMGGEMYAKRNPRVALNNQLFLMLCQRDDGRLPGCVMSLKRIGADWRQDPQFMHAAGDWECLGLIPDYGQLQGNALPYPAFKMYYMSGKPDGYLQMLAETIEAYDAYLWNTRDPYSEGVLQSWCQWDTGEDRCIRFGGSPSRWPHDYPPDGDHTPNRADPGDRARYYPHQWCTDLQLREEIRVPMRSMDLMAYSYEGRATRALISEVLGDGRAYYWHQKAEEVRHALRKHLWRPEKGAAYDKDRNNQWMDILVHNNLRCMYYGVFDQEMADEFIRRHLLNPKEFFTPVPLPSIAANDPMFRNAPGNNWSGQCQGLTWQRAIRALENYGRYAELTMLGRTFIKVLKAAGIFSQQLDPFDSEHPVRDYKGTGDYGPMLLSLMEYVAKFYGIELDRDQVYWSGLVDCGAAEYTQRFGARTYTLHNDGEWLTALVDGNQAFRCTAGVRIHTDMAGTPLKIIGIDTVTHQIRFSSGSREQSLEVKPNQVWSLANGNAACLAVDRPSFA